MPCSLLIVALGLLGPAYLAVAQPVLQEAVQAGRAEPVGSAAERAAAASIARIVQGRLVIHNEIAYLARHVSGAILPGGVLDLDIDIEPLYALEAERPAPSDAPGSDGTRRYRVPADAQCGLMQGAARVQVEQWQSAGRFLAPGEMGINVRSGNRFVQLNEVARTAGAGGLNILGTTPDRFIDVAGDGMRRLSACATEAAARGGPLRAVQLYAGDKLVARVSGPAADGAWVTGPGQGEDVVITRLVIEPYAGHATGLSVEMQAIATVSCGADGPHIELDGWKEGLSKPTKLRGDGLSFVVEGALPDAPVPALQAHTEEELRAELAQRTRSDTTGWACMPMLRGHRFVIKRGAEAVREVRQLYAGGC